LSFLFVIFVPKKASLEIRSRNL